MAKPDRELLRDLIESIPGAVCRWLPDEAWTMLFANDAIKALTGYAASDFFGEPPVRTFASVLHPEDRRPAFEKILLALEVGGPYLDEFRIVHADGTERWVLSNARAGRDRTGRVTHFDGTMFDITDRKRIEAELLCAKEDAEAASRAKTEFLAQMSHELRSPLNAILGFVDLLARDPGMGAEQREKLGIVDRSGQHLLDMIEQILSLSRLKARTVELRVDRFDLVEELEDIVQIARARAEGKGLGFSLELDPAIESAVVGDAGKIRQVLMNLLGNAVRYTDRGGIWLQARTEPWEGDPARRMLELDVADTGPGIPKDQIDRIFERFARGDGARDSDSGVGLGLAITRSLVTVMGGEIAVASEPGRGSLFKVRVPVRAGEDEDEPSAAPTEMVRLAPGQPEWRILVVDDGADNRLLLTTLLREAGFAVREATNGEVAVGLAVEWEPHLIWMDLRMPVMDGYEATCAIRRLPVGASVKIVALSAGAQLDSRPAVLKAGCDDLLSKPLRVGEVFERMARLLGVRYRPADPEREPTAAPSVALSRGMLAELPQSLLEPLRNAALRLDREAMEEAVAAIGGHAPVTARALHSLMRRLRMGRILELLDEVKS